MLVKKIYKVYYGNTWETYKNVIVTIQDSGTLEIRKYASDKDMYADLIAAYAVGVWTRILKVEE